MRAGEAEGAFRGLAARVASAVATLGPALTPTEAEVLLRRLVANPFDEEALSTAHRATVTDPAGRAMLLERIAAATRDNQVACHWLSQAEAIWSGTLRNKRNAARALTLALHRDPVRPSVVQRLIHLSRGDRDAIPLQAMIEERVRALLATGRCSLAVRVELAALYAAGGGEGCADTYEKFCRVLDPSPDAAALEWAVEQLRTEGDPVALRDVLVLAAGAATRTREQRKESLRELAVLSRYDLRDRDGAIRAWKGLLSLDRSDREARETLAGLLEEARQWDDLCLLLERAAASEPDVQKKVALQRRAAALHEGERNDLAAAADALAFVANVTPAPDAIRAAAAMFERAKEPVRAARIIADNVTGVEEPTERAALLARLGELREELSEPTSAAEAYAGAAELLGMALLWEAAERCFVAAEAWEGAARTLVARACGGGAPTERAGHFARAAEYFLKAGDEKNSRVHLELALDLDPPHGDWIRRLADSYAASQEWKELVDLVERCAGSVAEPATRVALRITAANVCMALLDDRTRSLAIWRRVLDDGDVQDALDPLIEDALARGDRDEIQSLIDRLAAVASQGAERSANAWRGKLETRVAPEAVAAAEDAENTEGDFFDVTDVAEVVDEAATKTAANEGAVAAPVPIDADATTKTDAETAGVADQIFASVDG
jgi:hypothetical protein